MHTARRKMQSQPYSQQAVRENEDLIKSKADIMVKRMLSGATSSSSGKTVDVYPLCGLFSLEVILECAFNFRCGESLDGESSQYLHCMDLSAKTVPINAVLPILSKLGIGRYVPGFIGTAFRSTERWADMTRAYLHSFQSNEKAFDTTFRFMATPLLVSNDEYLGRKLTNDEVLEEAMGIAFAGSGTTSTTVLYLLYQLSRGESELWQQRLRKEIHDCREAKGSDLRLTDLNKLPLLNAVIKETMRLHPTIISTLPRTLERELVITHRSRNEKTIVLPVGTDVGMQNYVHHHDPTTFPDPGEFLPQRWLDAEKDQLADMNAALTPFSTGQRGCIGQNLAKAELLLATAEVVSRLELQLDGTMTSNDMYMEDRFNIAPKNRKLLLNIKAIKD